MDKPRGSSWFFALTILVLFLSFFFNAFRVADGPWFAAFERDSESLVIGRLVKSAADGILSAGALTGRYTVPDLELSDDNWHVVVNYQYEAYLGNVRPLGDFDTYKSQSGFQGIAFSAADRFLDQVVGVPAAQRLRLFQGATAFLSAAVIGALIYWFLLEFGLTTACVVLAGSVFSQWLTVFGKNLWWCLWAFYVPVVAVMFYLRRRKSEPFAGEAAHLGLVVFVAVLVKCAFTGFEYITTTLLMLAVPVVFYAVLRRVPPTSAIKDLAVCALGSLLAISCSVLFLSLQIGSTTGRLMAGPEHIAMALAKRSYGSSGDFSPEYAQSLEAKPGEVLRTYLMESYFDSGNPADEGEKGASGFRIRLRYADLVLMLAVASVVTLFLAGRGRPRQATRPDMALLVASWFSILAPVSWFVIFKAHSYIHTHINSIAWEMPFRFFAFAVCGLAVVRVAAWAGRIGAGVPGQSAR